jgi:hypothetical protein
MEQSRTESDRYDGPEQKLRWKLNSERKKDKERKTKKEGQSKKDKETRALKPLGNKRKKEAIKLKRQRRKNTANGQF